MKESNIQQLVRLAASKLKGVRLFRNNVALAWVGDATQIKATMTVTLPPGSVVIRNARPLHAGLQKGSGDLIGWQSITITPDMVGTVIAKFVSVEVKTTKGGEREDQVIWKNVVNQHGGAAIVARDPADLEKINTK